MVIKVLKNFVRRMFSGLYKDKRDISLGFYGPPNAGKTSLANRICKDFTGEEIGSVSKVPHETRKVQFKEKVEISHKGKTMTFKMIDTPGIATKIDYEEFLKYNVNKIDMKKANIKQIESAFPDYDVVGISAKYGKNLEEFYESIFKLTKDL